MDGVLEGISTLAPREGSDSPPSSSRPIGRNFNPRSPRGERHLVSVHLHIVDHISTLAPREGSDPARTQRSPHKPDFNPRSPRGERPPSPPCGKMWAEFQPSLPARGATSRYRNPSLLRVFQPSLPARGATNVPALGLDKKTISTLAPREGSDFVAKNICPDVLHFNPRSPRGERQVPSKMMIRPLKFQPSLPARGATHFHPLGPRR